jgi:predicted nucleic acid-binding protein
VSNPTETHPPDPASWRLVLDEGEQLDVRLIPSAEPSGRADVEVRMSAMRADDLSRVLSGYSRIVAIMSETSEVSSTEGSLARGLRDAAAVARGTRSEPVPPTRIGSAQRLKAMAVLQQARWGLRRWTELSDWLGHVVILPIDLRVSYTGGQLASGAQHRGRPRPVNDMWIAAVSLAHGIPLATRNVKDYTDFVEHHGLVLLPY